MATWTPPRTVPDPPTFAPGTDETFAEAQDALERAVTPEQRRILTTWVWKCNGCGLVTLCRHYGGNLTPCSCPEPRDYFVSTIFGTARYSLGLVSDMQNWTYDPKNKPA